ncbi:MAG: hypothetical protein HYS69_02675 [candidate division NC10 bacterium]|nr:hypothetical protein [candidate division NC10 bacterium]
MRYRPAAAIIFVSGLLVAPLSHAANDLQQDLERLQRLRDAVEVDADSVEYLEAERKVIAKGGVRIGLEDRSLFADEVAVDLDDQTLVATGHVLLMEGLNRLEGDRIEYNYPPSGSGGFPPCTRPARPSPSGRGGRGSWSRASATATATASW